MEHEPKPSIADLNDAFRMSGENVVLTAGVAALDSLDGLLESVRTFDDFTPGNDPWGEHDCGSLEWEGENVFWKIDYTDGDEGYWVDPLAVECVRVMKIGFGSEY